MQTIDPQRGPETTPPVQQGLDSQARQSRQYVDQQRSERERLIAMRGKTKEVLYKQWLKNNEKGEIKKIDEDPKYLAKKEILSKIEAEEAFVLLGLVEKFMGGREKAMQVYASCWQGNNFKRDKLFAVFSKENTDRKLGFYYGSKTVTWEPDWTKSYESIKKIKGTGISYKLVNYAIRQKRARITLKGWWAHDIDDKWTPRNEWKDCDFKEGKNFQTAVIDKLSTKNTQGGYGDEWLGGSLAELQKNIGNELYPENANVAPGQRDSGLTPAQEGAVLQAFKGGEKGEGSLIAEGNDAYPEKIKKTMYEWFTKQQKEKWVALPEDKVGPMSLLFGKGCGNYLYRYSPENKKILMIRIDGVTVPPAEFGGYIALKDAEKELGVRMMQDEKTFEKTSKQAIDKMHDKDITKELIDAGKKVEGLKDLDRTKGMLVALPAMRRGIHHSKLEDDFYNAIRKDLHAKLEKEGIKEKSDRDRYIDLRIQDVKAQVEKKIADNELLSKAVKDNPETKVKFEISNDIVSVDFAAFLEKKAAQTKKAAEAAKGKVEGVAEAVNSKMASFERQVRKKFGRAAPIVMWIANVVFKLKDGLVDMAKGATTTTAAIMTSIAAGFLGIKGIRSIAGFNKLDQKILDEIIPKNKKEFVLRKRCVFKAETVTKHRIVIPKGVGIIGFGFPILIDGQRVEVKKPTAKEKQTAAKKGKGALMMLFKPAKEMTQYKDHEIVIEPGTKITKDTELGKGTKIIRV
ncbi:hypothetical protein JW911_01235 [Candidatus Peregrinibacteria bacterium]|nr:hypothetical protein [Candidatus Peregrinibacteria bacterium]